MPLPTLPADRAPAHPARAGAAAVGTAGGAPRAATARTDSAPVDRARADRTRADSTRADSARADSTRADSARADSTRADTGRIDTAAAAGAAADDSTADADSTDVDPVSIGKDVRTPAARLGTYLALAVGPIVVEELAPIGAGAAASQKEIALWPAVVVMTLGGWLATGLLYAFGRWRSAWIRRRFPRAATHVEKLLRAVGTRPWRSALAVRYAFGARVLLPVACGAAHVRPDVYFLASFVSSATWSAIFALVGFWFGQTAIAFLHRMARYDVYVVGVGVGAALIAWLVVRRRRGRSAPALVAPPAEPPPS